MKGIFLTQYGSPEKSFEMRETPIPEPKAGELLVKVEGFGLNFADVMARNGQYKDAPPLPALLGYDVCGKVHKLGIGVEGFEVGQRVTAMTRFGGYAEYAITDARASVNVPDTWTVAQATSITTQYCTAYYCAAEVVQLHPGDKVVIHSAAGGVGSALLQYCLYKGCEVFATTSSENKVATIKNAGAHHVINTSKEDFSHYVLEKTKGEGADVIFDAVGADSIRHGIQILSSGGRIVCYGAAKMNDAKNIFSTIVKGLQFGIYHPAVFMMNSKSLIGVNMLKIADNKPEILRRCLQNVVGLIEQEVFTPNGGKVFQVSEIAEAHRQLENRGSTGKIACAW